MVNGKISVKGGLEVNNDYSCSDKLTDKLVEAAALVSLSLLTLTITTSAVAVEISRSSCT